MKILSWEGNNHQDDLLLLVRRNVDLRFVSWANKVVMIMLRSGFCSNTNKAMTTMLLTKSQAVFLLTLFSLQWIKTVFKIVDENESDNIQMTFSDLSPAIPRFIVSLNSFKRLDLLHNEQLLILCWLLIDADRSCVFRLS